MNKHAIGEKTIFPKSVCEFDVIPSLAKNNHKNVWDLMEDPSVKLKEDTKDAKEK